MTSQTPPEALNPAELSAWTSLLGTVIWLPAALDTHMQRETGLSHSEYQVLWWLSVSDGGTRRMGDLADTASVTASHLSRIATRMEKRGWIGRRPDSADGRQTIAYLTDSGWAKVAVCQPHYTTALRALVFDRLDPTQLTQLETIMTGILTPLKPCCTPANRAASSEG
ncbi:MarR family winged helix-turn-helix transcriptional regulator [Umezawaea tangerina]|uniref:DNA-binding MarR family transcriptional regulator n=1 Tax=Umezawaea tangerina TaxID=84725 RepID=A0A2T0TGU2_9PSEU|nr:MarR family winged helix-turn-helix transcriptional regulator [Umezawaea tangerina]PRY44932.1 DNA-binding MarR family transcriptional regulator [Umezawaea tangerina]